MIGAENSGRLITNVNKINELYFIVIFTENL